MMSNYLIWKYKSVPHACVLGELSGLEDDFRLNKGIPLERDFHEDVAFHMHPDFPNDLLLVDNLLNSDMVIVAHQRLKDLLQARNILHLEYLPVNIIDHKNRKISSQQYYIIHAINPVDCIDGDQSVFTRSLINRENIASFEQLVIDEARIPADRQIFRLKGFWKIILIRRDLAEELDKEGFSGLGWLELADYPEK